MTMPKPTWPENIPTDDDSMRRMMERCNDTGTAYPPEVLDWMKKQPKGSLRPR